MTRAGGLSLLGAALVALGAGCTPELDAAHVSPRPASSALALAPPNAEGAGSEPLPQAFLVVAPPKHSGRTTRPPAPPHAPPAAPTATDL